MKRAEVFYQLVYHFVWGTKNHELALTPEVERCLLPYMAAKCKEWEYTLYAANGALDHFHLLIGLTPSMLVADVAKRLKGASSHYINHGSGLTDRLYWQDGYGVITIRSKEIPRVTQYIQNQKEHHNTGRLSGEFERTALQ